MKKPILVRAETSSKIAQWIIVVSTISLLLLSVYEVTH